MKSAHVFITIILLFSLNHATSEYFRVCYFTNWAQYRNGNARFTVGDIEPTLCTHISYAFAQINNATFKLEKFEGNDRWMYMQINNLKVKNPKLKTLLAVGGWNHELYTSPFSDMVRTRERREIFIDQATRYVRDNGFDGLDLDWEYPGDTKRFSSPDDKHRFTLLCKELKERFENEAKESGKKRLLLTAAVPANAVTVDNGYEVSKLASALDFVCLLTYDLYGGWNKVTGHHTSMANSYYNVPKTIKTWVSRGMPRNKIVLGLATYGRTFILDNPFQHKIGSKASRAGMKGSYTGADGILAYYEICSMSWTDTVQNTAALSPYSYNINTGLWAGYDDEGSIKRKVQLLVNEKLLGAMVWALDFDDFSGHFCGKGSYPLIKAMKSELQRLEPTKASTTTTTTTTTTKTTTTTSPTPKSTTTTTTPSPKSTSTTTTSTSTTTTTTTTASPKSTSTTTTTITKAPDAKTMNTRTIDTGKPSTTKQTRDSTQDNVGSDNKKSDERKLSACHLTLALAICCLILFDRWQLY